ncbi:MAG TPA: hypothetical protein VKU19_39090 [Bryobacteraceae bacterium]|nr:hypothetical protein [Bryobacteraceae bacterium]
MRRFGHPFLLLVALSAPAMGSHIVSECGTTRETSHETLFFHRQAMRARPAARPRAASANRDIGNIAIIEDSDGVVARQNQFNLDLKTLHFLPAGSAASHYSYSVTDGGYDTAAAASGTPLAALDDDDTRQFTLPFAFPFFGAIYTQVYVNSDGNLTFGAGDSASTDRSLGRMTAGAPRIAPLFDDLDPALTAGGVRFFADGTRVVVSWVAVPEWQASGLGPHQTFQVKLYPDGRVEFSYSGISATSAVVGIAPGSLAGGTSLVDFRNDPSGDYSGAAAERFGNSLQIDVVTAAQKFYQTHEDSYDYLVIYNNEGISALGEGVLAYESTVRNPYGSGYGVANGDDGAQYGSKSRLQAVLNLGMLSQYPADVTALVPARAPQGDTPLSILAHESGHLFLAYASITDPNDPSVHPMLGYQNVHWSFAFNSEASVMEGERIVDEGTAVSPEFLTTDTVQQYAPLDQYLMGFRAPIGVPDTFVVRGVPAAMTQWHPLRGYSFDGQRQNVSVNEVIQAMGRRTPDSTVAQRHFRFAFIMIVAQGTAPSSADLTQIDTYRQQFESFYAKASGNNAAADTSLTRTLRLSVAPASGVVAGGSTTATVTVQTAPVADLIIALQAPNGNATLPASVKIAAGATSASFPISGARAGVEEVSAIPGDTGYETAYARIQVADAGMLRLVAVSGDRQVSDSAATLPDPVVASLTDDNHLVYSGVRIVATPSAGGSVLPALATSDSQGRVSFRWTPGPGASNQLQLAVESMPSVSLTVNAGSAVPVISNVVNSASFAAGVAAGALVTIQGVHLSAGQTATGSLPWPAILAGVQVLLNGSAMPLAYVSDSQINLYVPPDAALGDASLSVVTPGGARATVAVNIAAQQPGIFAGGVIHAGTTASALTTPVQAGDFLEIYCTGLGPTQAVGTLHETISEPTVFVGAIPVQPVYSGLTSGFPGLYEVDVQVPSGVAPGVQPLVLSINLSHSNAVSITVK